MRPPKSLIAAMTSIAAFAFAPAFAEQPKQVEIQIEIEAPAKDIYRSIRKQAWAACKPETGSHYIYARTAARRACQQKMVADFVNALSQPEVMALAAKDGVFTAS